MKSFRKLLAVLLSALMLFSLLPLSTLVIADGENLLADGDFEADDGSWKELVSTIDIVDDPTNSGHGKVMKTNENGSQTHMFQQEVSDLLANSDYVLKFKVYTYAASGTKPGFWATLGKNTITYSTGNVTCSPMEVKTVDSSSSTRVRFTCVATNSYNKWIDVEIPFNTQSNTSTTIMFSNYRESAGQYYFDDVSLELVGVGTGGGNDIPTVDDSGDMMLNGDFETGTLSNWTNLYGACTTSFVAGRNDSKYALHFHSDKQWSQVNQKVEVNKNTDYVMTAWVKDATSFTLLVKDAGNMNNISQTAARSGSEWIQYEVKFNSGNNNYVHIILMANQDGGDAIVDDVMLFRKPVVDENTNLVSNGDFETASLTGWTNLYNACTVKFTTGREGSKYAMDFSAASQWAQVRQEINVQPNSDYLVSMWLKNPKNVSIVIKTGDDQNDIATAVTTPHADWQLWEVPFNSGENTSIHILLVTNQAGGSTIVDDVSCLKQGSDDPNAPSGIDVMTNGNFETGDSTGWEKSQSSTIDNAAARSGKFGAHLQGNGGSDIALKQTVTIDPGKTYRLSFWYKPVTNGMNFRIATGDNRQLGASYLDSRITTKWTKYELTFESATTTSVILTFSGSNKGSADELMLDDMKLENMSGEDMDRLQLLNSGGFSVRDTKDGGRGLAFRFDLAVNGAQADGYVYQQNSGTMKLFKYSDKTGTLVKFGAVVTNDEAMGTDDALTLENVSGTTTIDVPAKYVLETKSAKLSYAVRIIDIPQHCAAINIYARPYYIYEMDGKQVIVYGDIVSENYAHVDSTSSSIRILTIGDETACAAVDSLMYDVFKQAGYEDVILGDAYTTDNGYTYQRIDASGNETVTGATLREVVQNQRWQYVIIADPAMTATELRERADWIQRYKTNSDLKVLWNLPWTGTYTGNVTTAKAAAKVSGVHGVIPTGTAIENLLTILDKSAVAPNGILSDNAQYAMALTWYATITGNSVENVEYAPQSVSSQAYDLQRAAARATYTPYEISDLSEVLLIAGSDFQPGTHAAGLATLQSIFGGITSASGEDIFDGLLFVGDYTTGNEVDLSTQGLAALDGEMSKHVTSDRIYSQGNHDKAGTVGMTNHGPNDPAGAPYGVFVINEDKYDCYGNGGDKVAAELTTYFNEKLAGDWGNKPIFVMSHLPLHYNYRTRKDKMGLTAHYIIDAMNAASDAGLNIIYLFGHNHSGGYDDYAGGGAIYIPKGESIQMVDPNGYTNPSITKQLRFTYMNAGYVSYYADMNNGSETCLSMSLFRIQKDGSVIITRYTKNGVHNLKSAGALTKDDADFTVPDMRVYESSRIVSAFVDEPYEK